MKTEENGTTEIVGNLLTRLKPHPGSDLWPFRLFHPFIYRSFPSTSSLAPGKNTLPPDYCVLPSFLSAVLARNNSKMAKLYGISGDRSLVIDENMRQYRDILLSQDIRDIPSPQDIQKIQDARTFEDVKRVKSAGSCQEDLSSTMLSHYNVDFHNIHHHATGKVPDELHHRAKDTEEGSYSGQGYLDCGSRRFGRSECYRNLNVSGTEKLTEETSASGDFYSASGEAFLRTVTSPSSLHVKPKTGAGEGVPPGTPNATTFDPNLTPYSPPSRESCRDDDVMENGADHPPRSNEDRNKIDELDQSDLSYDDPNTSKGSDGERKEENYESPNEEKTYSCPVCAFTSKITN